VPRPSHADYTYQVNNGVGAPAAAVSFQCPRDDRPVAPGRSPRKCCANAGGGDRRWVSSVGEFEAAPIDTDRGDPCPVDATLVRCPDAAAAEADGRLVRAVREAKTQWVAWSTACARKLPAGWGERCSISSRPNWPGDAVAAPPRIRDTAPALRGPGCADRCTTTRSCAGHTSWHPDQPCRGVLAASPAANALFRGASSRWRPSARPADRRF